METSFRRDKFYRFMFLRPATNFQRTLFSIAYTFPDIRIFRGGPANYNQIVSEVFRILVST